MTKVLFVCVRNGGKSQMAGGLMRAENKDVKVDSAGIDAGPSLNAASVESLAEVGIDISDQSPKQITDELIRSADVVVTLGRDAQVHHVPGPRYQVWDIDEPSLRGIDGMERMRLVRDDIARHVTELASQLRQNAGAHK